MSFAPMSRHVDSHPRRDTEGLWSVVIETNDPPGHEMAGVGEGFVGPRRGGGRSSSRGGAAIEGASEFAFGEPSVGERLSVHEDARGE